MRMCWRHRSKHRVRTSIDGRLEAFLVDYVRQCLRLKFAERNRTLTTIHTPHVPLRHQFPLK
jgi:hypothetical protein